MGANGPRPTSTPFYLTFEAPQPTEVEDDCQPSLNQGIKHYEQLSKGLWALGENPPDPDGTLLTMSPPVSVTPN